MKSIDMKKRWTSILAMLSFLLLIGTALLWRRSRETGDYAGYMCFEHEGDHSIAYGIVVTSGRGAVGFNAGWAENTDPTAEDTWRSKAPHGVYYISHFYPSKPSIAPPPHRELWGFGYGYGRFAATVLKENHWHVGAWAPYWAFMTLWSVPLLRYWSAYRRRQRGLRRLRLGCCSACGYNLTGCNSARCPECGESRSTLAATTQS